MGQLRQRLLATVVGQLGHPHGPLGPVVARALNRGNGRAIADGVTTADVRPGATVADIVAALQRAGLQVEHRRIGGKPLPRYVIVGQLAGPRAS